MLLRSLPSPIGVRLQRLFHSGAVRRANIPKNHYEILQVPTNATPAEVKKYAVHLFTLPFASASFMREHLGFTVMLIGTI